MTHKSGNYYPTQGSDNNGNFDAQMRAPKRAVSLARKLDSLNPTGVFYWLLMGESRSGLSNDYAILYVDANGQLKPCAQLSPDDNEDPVYNPAQDYTLAKVLGGRLKRDPVVLPVIVLPARPPALLAAKRMLGKLGEWIGGDLDSFVSRDVGGFL